MIILLDYLTEQICIINNLRTISGMASSKTSFIHRPMRAYACCENAGCVRFSRYLNNLHLCLNENWLRHKVSVLMKCLQTLFVVSV